MHDAAHICGISGALGAQHRAIGRFILVARIVIIAGETSGDRLAAGLIKAARVMQPDIEFEGVAGPEMVSAGCTPWHDSSELAVMGIFEVLRDLPRLRRLMADLEARILRNPPDVFVGVDAPDFNLRLETRLRTAGIRDRSWESSRYCVICHA